MPRRGSERSVRYSSDNSSSADDRRQRHRRPRQRDRSPSEDSYTTRQSRYSGRAGSERAETGGPNLGKATIAVGLLAALAGLLKLWSVRKNAEREREAKRERREAFERSKAARRRDEARRERQRQRNRSPGRSPPSEVRRIGARDARSLSPTRTMLRIEAPPVDSTRPSRRTLPGERNDDYDGDYRDDRRSRRG